MRRLLPVLVSVLLVALAPAARGLEAEKKPVNLKVLLPQANAKLTIDGAATRQFGTERRFESPPLDPAKSYTYTLVAVWEPNNYETITRTRVIPVKAGAEVTADLTRADDKRPDDLFIRYVPTPRPVVDAMLKLGSVGEKDVVYDLGCGDGRIVIAAVASARAKRGVGVDLDPERIKESKAAAKAARVEDRVEFRQEDVLKVKDLADASVVMLYLSDDLNVRLRPLLQKALKPGSRVVSHRFKMGDWEPERSIAVTDDAGKKYDLHLWAIGGKK